MQDPSLPVVEGNEAKPLQVVYEPFTQNKVKEVAIRGTTLTIITSERHKPNL